MNRKVGDMLWPAPGVEMDKLEWRIRYGWMSREDFFGNSSHYCGLSADDF